MVCFAPAPRLKRWGGVLFPAALLAFALCAAQAQAVSFHVQGKATLNGIGIGGVTMSGLPGNPLTDSNGAYDVLVPQGWSGTVRPVKTGLTFSPSFRTYTSVQRDRLTQDYTATNLTYKISGVVTSGGAPVVGAVVYGLPGNPATSVTGQYSAWVDYGWSGTATPAKVGFVFLPTSRTYANVTKVLANQDYVGTAVNVAISGHVTKDGVGVAGVVVDGFGGSVVTNVNGRYSATVGYGFSGLAIPSRAGSTFEPPNRAYSNVMTNLTNQNFVATQITFTVQGTILSNGSAVAGVTLAGFPNNPVTDANGNYTATVEYGWGGTAAPSKGGYTFNPANRSYSNVVANLIGEDYAGTEIFYEIAGLVSDNGQPVPGVTISGLPGNPVTPSSGRYKTYVPYGWSGTFSAQKAGYIFDPPSRYFSGVHLDHLGQDFVAVLPRGAPVLQSLTDADHARLHMTWTNPALTPAQFLGLVWDIYAGDWAKNTSDSVWTAFLPTASAGNVKLSLTGGYHAWLFNQYSDGGAYLSNPLSNILYSGTPHTPADVAVTVAPTLLQTETTYQDVTLSWRPDIYGTWLYQVIVYDLNASDWTTTIGPGGDSMWHFIDYGGFGYAPGEADFFQGWGKFKLVTPGQYAFFIGGRSWLSPFPEWGFSIVTVGVP